MVSILLASDNGEKMRDHLSAMQAIHKVFHSLTVYHCENVGTVMQERKLNLEPGVELGMF